jgi:ABC-type antimicrobial peptide transport system permease subunit
VLSYAVSHHRREIGIRMALGAPSRAIQRLFVQRGVVLTSTGIVVGIGAAAGVTRLMRTLLFGISPLDPLTFATVSVPLAAAALLASYLPARRALSVDPIETMRAE